MKLSTWLTTSRGRLLAGMGLIACTSTVARAQETTAPAPANEAAPATGSGDIVVTARRVAESLQRVPLSVTAFGAEQLTARSLLSQADLQRSVPGLTVRSSQSNNEFNFSIRGQSLDLFTSSSGAVLPYFNDVQVTPFGVSSFYDLQSIQALKGPQGTLFGRNATGGAVLFTTAKPTDKLEGFLTGRIGNYAMREVEGAINLPVVEDKIELRLAGNIARRRGYQYNIYLDEHEGRVSRESGRVSLMLKPAEGIESLTVVQYDHSGGNNLQLETRSVTACGQPGVSSTASCLYSPALDQQFGPGAYAAYRAAHPLAQAGGFPEQVAFQKSLGPWRVNTLNPSLHRSHAWVYTNTTSFELSDQLTIKNIMGGTSTRSLDNRDPVGSGPYYIQGQSSDANVDYGGEYQGFLQRRKQFSEELQLVGTAFNESMNYIVGGYYGYLRNSPRAILTFVELRPFFGPTVQGGDTTTENRTYGLYAQATQDLSEIVGVEGLKFTGGFRYTWEDTRLAQGPLSNVVTNDLGNAAVNPAELTQSASFKKPSWTIGFDWQATPSLLLYAAQRGSWRSGGFNDTGPARSFTAAEGGNLFKPETTYDVEIGAKFGGQVAGRPARLNIALYNQWIKDVQRATFVTIPAAQAVGGIPSLNSLTANLPKARVRGVEADAMISPADWLELGGTLAYTDAKYTNGLTALFGVATEFGPYADTPKWTGGAYAQVTLPTSESVGRITLRGDVYAQSSQYFSNLANSLAPNSRIPGYKLVNGRIDWNIGSSNITVSGFIKNAFKVTNYSGGIALIPYGVNGVLPGEPRTFGASASVKF